MENWIEITAIITGPLAAVLITLLYSSIREKKQQKINLFLTLVKDRKTDPIPEVFVNSLNMIDVVFHRKKKVLVEWKKVYESFQAVPFNPAEYELRLLDLLDVMANALGYNKIKQTTLSAFYQPQLYASKQQFQQKVNEELLRVLENSDSFSETKKPK